MSRAFTLIELLVVIAISTALIAILLSAVRQSKVIAIRIECMSKIRGVNLSTFAYASDNTNHALIKAKFYATNEASPIGLNEESWRAFEQYGFGLSQWKCPGRTFEPSLNIYGALNHTYMYFGGIEKWQGAWGVANSRSPITLDDLSYEVAVITDSVVRSQPSTWQPDAAWLGGYALVSQPHGRNDDYSPTGSNHIFGDGSGEWIDQDQLMPLHTWSPTEYRQPFWYQHDIGELQFSSHLDPP